MPLAAPSSSTSRSRSQSLSRNASRDSSLPRQRSAGTPGGHRSLQYQHQHSSPSTAASPSHRHYSTAVPGSSPPVRRIKSQQPRQSASSQKTVHRQSSYLSSPDNHSSVASSSIHSSTPKEGREPHLGRDSNKSFREELSTPSKNSSSSRSSKLRGEKLAMIKKTIADVNKHLNDDKLTAKLSQACKDWDHWDEKRHNAELHYGAANVLSLALTMTNNENEISLIVAGLEMVLRAAHKHVISVYEKISESTIPQLMDIITHQQHEAQSPAQAGDTIANAARSLLYFSRIPELRTNLARFPGVMDMLISAHEIRNPQARTFCSRVIANLANSEDNKVFMVENKELLNTVLRMAVTDTVDEVKEYAAATLMDFAACPDNQIVLASNDTVLATMVKLATTEGIPETREAAATGLQNLAFCQANRTRLIEFRDGVVLDTLKKTLSTDINDKARRRAAGALTNMACDETAEAIGNRKGLLETLAVAATKDHCGEVQSRAAMALTKIATSISYPMRCYRTLLDALVVASLTNATNSVSQVLRVKARDQLNRESMARHPGILDTLSDIGQSSDYCLKDREHAMRAIMHLTNEDCNHRIMCQKTILDCLVVGSVLPGDKWKDVRESAIIAMERLATDVHNRPVMARHTGLLSAVAKVVEMEQKLIDARADSNHDRLAKPLLMSLLLAL